MCVSAFIQMIHRVRCLDCPGSSVQKVTWPYYLSKHPKKRMALHSVLAHSGYERITTFQQWPVRLPSVFTLLIYVQRDVKQTRRVFTNLLIWMVMSIWCV